MAALTQARLKELLHYDPETGVFTWMEDTGTKRADDIAGSISTKTGYVTITIKRKHLLAHRLAHLYIEGYLPEHNIDHINGNPSDNMWCNLRHVTQSCNMQNAKMKSHNKSGYKGVSWSKDKSKWVSQITVHKKQIMIGRFNCPLEAALARIAVEDCHPGWHCDERCANRKKVFGDLRAICPL